MSRAPRSILTVGVLGSVVMRPALIVVSLRGGSNADSIELCPERLYEVDGGVQMVGRRQFRPLLDVHTVPFALAGDRPGVHLPPRLEP